MLAVSHCTAHVQRNRSTDDKVSFLRLGGLVDTHDPVRDQVPSCRMAAGHCIRSEAYAEQQHTAADSCCKQSHRLSLVFLATRSMENRRGRARPEAIVRGRDYNRQPEASARRNAGEKEGCAGASAKEQRRPEADLAHERDAAGRSNVKRLQAIAPRQD